MDTTSSSGDQRVRVRPGKRSRAALSTPAPSPPTPPPGLRKVLRPSLISKRKPASEPTHPGRLRNAQRKSVNRYLGRLF